MRYRVLAGVAALALAGAIAGSAGAFRIDEATSVASRADDFRLVDHTGYAQSLRRLVDVKAIVVVSQVNGDAGSRAAAKSLEALKTRHADVAFLMLNSSLQDGRAEIAAEAKGQAFTIPVLDDDVQLAGEQLGVTHAAEAFVLQPKTLNVLYHGSVEGVGKALGDIAAGKAVAVSEIKASGAPIAFPERERKAQHGKISYATDVAPILADKCLSCHQDGGIGPFAMKDYSVVKGFAPMIREALRTDTMPPWHPDPTIGKFKHDASLTSAQIKTVVHWIEAGAPRGDGADPLAAAVGVAPEWPLGKPDLIINAPAYAIPASGVVQYQYPTAPNPLTEGRWVKAASIMPGDRRGVHHILAGYISGAPKAGPASAGQWEANYGEYAVGGESFQVPAGLGIYLPPGGSMGFQMHYTPYGKEAVDNSRIGFYFYKNGEMPEKIMRHTVIADNFIELPPETDKHKEVAYLTFPKEALLYSVFLHTHYRGEAGSLDMVMPDGSKTALINLPRYDFNWQRTYDFAEPIRVPAGAKLVATYLYDNSVRNGANPDPKSTVTWGDQSWEEMHYTSLYYQWTDERVGKEADATSDMRSGRLIGMLDDNLDDKIQLAEVRGRIAAFIKPRFEKLDVNHDGAIDVEEFKAATDLMQMFGSRRERDQQQ
jgi:mono/diheme cytochrome c family protein